MYHKNVQLKHKSQRMNTLLHKKNQSAFCNSVELKPTIKPQRSSCLSQTIKSQEKNVDSVLLELSHSIFLNFYEQFQQRIHTIFHNLSEKVIILELKIAECQKNFNRIALDLKIKRQEISGIMIENNQLIKANHEVEEQLRKLKSKYEKSVREIENLKLSKNIEGLRKSIDQMERKSEFFQRQKNQTLLKIKTCLEEINKKIISSPELKLLIEPLQKIISYVGQDEKPYGSLLQEKILENIDLKFMKYEEKIFS